MSDTTPPIPGSHAPAKSRLDLLTRPKIAWPTVAVSVVLLGWSLLFRLPNAPEPVKARSASPVLPSSELVTAKRLAELQAASGNAARHLMRDSKEIAPALSRLEQSARASGFQVDVSMGQAITNAAGFKELTIYPATIRLEDNYKQDPAAFTRALEALHEAGLLPGKVEIGTLTLRSNGAGLAQAQVELQFWLLNEEPAAK